MAMTLTPDPAGHVAFFRNMNLGQARSKSPTSAVLVEAFLTAGAERAVNFQTNGTVIFSVGTYSDASAPDVILRVRPLLRAATGYTDAVVVRSATWVAELAPRLDPGLHGGEVALFDAATVPQLELPWTDPAGEVAIVELGELHAVTAWAAAGPARGSNSTLTRMVGVPVTCRGVPTMIRLANRLSPPASDHEESRGRPPAPPGSRTVRPSGNTR